MIHPIPLGLGHSVMAMPRLQASSAWGSRSAHHPFILSLSVQSIDGIAFGEKVRRLNSNPLYSKLMVSVHSSRSHLRKSPCSDGYRRLHQWSSPGVSCLVSLGFSAVGLL